MDGFTTLAGIVPALAFHAISSAAGWHLLSMAAKRADAQRGMEASPAAAT
jgi:hypothetical protein